MSSRVKKVTSTLLAASIFFSYGVNLFADGEIIESDDPVVAEEEVTEEGDEAFIPEEPDEETVEAEEPEADEDPIEAEEDESYDVIIDEEDAEEVSPASNETVFQIDLINELGNPWEIFKSSSLYGFYLHKDGTVDDFTCNVKFYDIDGNLMIDKEVTYTDSDFDSNTGLLNLFDAVNKEYTKNGTTNITITLTDYNGGYYVEKPDELKHSRIMVNYEEVTEPSYPDIAQGTTTKIQLYPAKGVTGTFGFYDYAGLLEDEGLVYNFNFNIYENNTTNDDLSQVYWTLDSDPDTKHFLDTHRSGYYLLVRIPLGHEITLYNLPQNSTITSFFPNSLPFYNTIYSFDGACPEYTRLTYNDQNLTYNDIYDLGFYTQGFYTFDPGDNGGQSYSLVGSGQWSYHHWGDGYRWDTYITRLPAQLMFTKEYDPADDTVDPDETHTFKITLTDTVSGKPFADQDVAYYLAPFGRNAFGYGYWENDGSKTGTYTEIDYDNDQLTAHTDADGVMEITVPANCYVVLGRVAPYDMGEARELYQTEHSYFYSSQSAYMTGIGMLPDHIGYEIEEIGDDYEDSVTGDASGVLSGYYEYFSGNDEIKDILWYLNNRTSIDIPRFINTRNTGSLTVEKVVTGYDDGRSFEFTLTLTDPATGFPTSISYTLSDGTTGTATLTAGDPVQINGKDVPTYEYTFELTGGSSITFTDIPSGTDYEVVESASSSAGYTVTYTNADGEIVTSGTTATITNDMPVGDLEIEKVVTGDTTSDDYDADTGYEINVSFDSAGTYTVSENGAAGYEKDFGADEEVSFTIRAGETILISNIPEGTGYTVTETALSQDLTDEGYATGNITSGTGTITKDVTAEVKVNNTFTEKKETPTPTPEESTPTPTSTPVPVSSFTVTKSSDVDKTIECGQQITYSITVTNTGDTEITGIVVRDFIPDRTHYISCDNDGERGAIDGKQHVTWFIESLGVGEEVVLKMTVQVNECVPNGTIIKNTAYYKETGTPEKPGTNEDMPEDTLETTNEVIITVHSTIVSAAPSTGESLGVTVAISTVLFIISGIGMVIYWKRWREDYEDRDM